MVHDCEHDPHASLADSDEDDDSGLSYDQDDCFICEFQLDYCEVPQFTIPKVAKANNVVLAPGEVGEAQGSIALCYTLRGPPALV